MMRGQPPLIHPSARLLYRSMHLSRPNLEGIFNIAHKYKYNANFLEVWLKIDIPYVYMYVYVCEGTSSGVNNRFEAN